VAALKETHSAIKGRYAQQPTQAAAISVGKPESSPAHTYLLSQARAAYLNTGVRMLAQIMFALAVGISLGAAGVSFVDSPVTFVMLAIFFNALFAFVNHK
jgi:hypothetical protein